jgi:hypothetical protein
MLSFSLLVQDNSKILAYLCKSNILPKGEM